MAAAGGFSSLCLLRGLAYLVLSLGIEELTCPKQELQQIDKFTVLSCRWQGSGLRPGVRPGGLSLRLRPRGLELKFSGCVGDQFPDFDRAKLAAEILLTPWCWAG